MSSIAMTHPRPSTSAVEFLYKPSSPPDAKLSKDFVHTFRRLQEWAECEKPGAIAFETGSLGWELVEGLASTLSPVY